jgi:hypothetical protein
MARPKGKKNTKQYSEWTYQQEREFRRLYYEMSNSQLAKYFDKSRSAVASKARELGMRKLSGYKTCSLEDVEHEGPALYGIRNISNGKVYIGYASNLKTRMRTHRRKFDNEFMQRDCEKYGLTSFEVLLICIEGNTQDMLKLEQQYLNGLDQKILYNKNVQHHLELGTDRDNMLDTIKAGNHKNGSKSRFGKEDVEKMIELRKSGKTYQKISEEFGSTKDVTIWSILTGKTKSTRKFLGDFASTQYDYKPIKKPKVKHVTIAERIEQWWKSQPDGTYKLIDMYHLFSQSRHVTENYFRVVTLNRFVAIKTREGFLVKIEDEVKRS